MNQQPDPAAVSSPRWWRFPYVWLVLAGPAAVVAAAVATAVIAVRGADTVVTERSFTPALQGRNHAATPAVQPR